MVSLWSHYANTIDYANTIGYAKAIDYANTIGYAKAFDYANAIGGAKAIGYANAIGYAKAFDYANAIGVPLGKPTRLAPIPKPAPERADAPIAGSHVSRIANVADATKAKMRHSSIFRERFGIVHAARATKIPSITYLIMRREISPKSSILSIILL